MFINKVVFNSFTNKRNKNTVRVSNKVVFYKTRCDEVDSTSLAPPASVKMNSRTPNEDAEQLFYRAPLDSYFTNLINTKFTSSFIRTQKIT